MSITYLFLDTCNLKLSNCKDIINYISQYQIAFDNIFNLHGEDL